MSELYFSELLTPEKTDLFVHIYCSFCGKQALVGLLRKRIRRDELLQDGRSLLAVSFPADKTVLSPDSLCIAVIHRLVSTKNA